jgi:hypothetical protein
VSVASSSSSNSSWIRSGISGSAEDSELADLGSRTDRGEGVTTEDWTEESTDVGVLRGDVSGVNEIARVGVLGTVGALGTTRAVGCWNTGVSLLRGRAAGPDVVGTAGKVGLSGIGKDTLCCGAGDILVSGV